MQASAQTSKMSSSSSASLLHSLLVFVGMEIFLGLYNFLDTNTILVVTPPTYALDVDTAPV